MKCKYERDSGEIILCEMQKAECMFRHPKPALCAETFDRDPADYIIEEEGIEGEEV